MGATAGRDNDDVDPDEDSSDCASADSVNVDVDCVSKGGGAVDDASGTTVDVEPVRREADALQGSRVRPSAVARVGNAEVDLDLPLSRSAELS